MNANFGLLDPLSGKLKKDRKKELLVERAQADFRAWLDETGVLVGNGLRQEFTTEDTERSLSH
jgi:hypothetical protein